MFPTRAPHLAAVAVPFGALFRNTTANGGDMGAHVWWPWFMRDHWFGHFRLAGWAPDWYAGFPVGQFYFPLPAVLIALLDIFMPYNVAFKLVTVSGAAAAPGRRLHVRPGLRCPWPSPPAFALARDGVPLQHARNETGRSTAATSRATSRASSPTSSSSRSCLFFLAAFARTLDTRQRLWLPAVLLAATVLCHIVVIVFGGRRRAAVWLTRRPLRTWPSRSRSARSAGCSPRSGAVPLLLRQPYTQSMRYEKVVPSGTSASRSVRWLLPGAAEHLIEGLVQRLMARATWCAGQCAHPVGAAVDVGARRRRGARRGRVAAGVDARAARWRPSFAVMFVLAADQHVWNTRFLPLYFLSLSLLCGDGRGRDRDTS